MNTINHLESRSRRSPIKFQIQKIPAINQSQTYNRTEATNISEFDQRILSQSLGQRSPLVNSGVHRKSMQDPQLFTQNLLKDDSREIIQKVKLINQKMVQNFKRASKRQGHQGSRLGSLIEAIRSKKEVRGGRSVANPGQFTDSIQMHEATLLESPMHANHIEVMSAPRGHVRGRYARNMLQLGTTTQDMSAHVSNLKEYDSMRTSKQSQYQSFRVHNKIADLQSIRASVNGMDESHVSKAYQAAKLHALQKVPRRMLQLSQEFNQIIDKYRMSIERDVLPASSVGYVYSSVADSEVASGIHGASIDDSTQIIQSHHDDVTGVRTSAEWTQVELQTLGKVCRKNMLGVREPQNSINLRQRRAPTKYSQRENSIDISGIMQLKVKQMIKDQVQESSPSKGGFFSPQITIPNQNKNFEKQTGIGEPQTKNHRIGREMFLFKKRAQLGLESTRVSQQNSFRYCLPPVQTKILATEETIGSVNMTTFSKQPDFERTINQYDHDFLLTKSQFNTLPSKRIEESPRESIQTVEEMEKAVQRSIQLHQREVDLRLVHWLKLLQAYNASRNLDLSDLGDLTKEGAQALRESKLLDDESFDPLDWLPISALCRSRIATPMTVQSSLKQLNEDEKDKPMLVADLIQKFQKSIQQKQKQLIAEQKQSRDYIIFSPTAGGRQSKAQEKHLNALKKIKTHLEAQLDCPEQKNKDTIEHGLIAVDYFVSQIKTKQKFFSKDPQKVRASDAPVAPLGKAGQRENSEVTAFSILNSIKDQSLELNDIKLGDAICQELSRRLNLLISKVEIRRLVLDNNGISEQSMTSILEAFARLKNFKILLIKNNTISWESLSHLERSLRYTPPGNLSELRLINCRIQSKDMLQLLEALSQSTLRRLSLVGLNFAPDTFDLLLDLVERLKTLIELDLSWCNLSSKCISNLVDVLQRNRVLQSVDLSWNNFQEVQGHKQCQLSETDQNLLSDLSVFIVHNRHLKRLNLSHCNLNQAFLAGLVQTLKHAQSLQVLELTGNQGLEEIRELAKETLKMDDYLGLNFHDLNRVTEQARQMGRQIMSNHKQVNLMQSIELQRLKEAIVRKNMVNSKTVQEDHRFLFQRVLGHKHDLPGLEKWKEVSSFTSPQGLRNDWLSSHHKYTLVFWSINHAEHQMKHLKIDYSQVHQLASLLQLPELEEIEQIIKKRPNQLPSFSEAYNGQFQFLESLGIKDPATLRPPMWAGSLTNWKYLPMFRAEDFIQMLDPQFDDPFKELKSEGQFGRQLIKTVQDLGRPEFQAYLDRRSKQANHYRQNFSTLLDKHLKCTNPQLVNYEEFQTSFRGKKIDPIASKRLSQDSAVEKSSVRKSIEMHIQQKRASELDRFDSPVMDQEEKILEHLELCFPGLTDDQAIKHQVWIGVALASPGKHQFVVNYEKPDSACIPQNKLSFHTCLVNSHGQIFKTGAQKPKNQQAVEEPQFFKSESIFQDWNPDTEFVLNYCFQSDIEHIKFNQIIDMETVEAEKEMNEIKTAIRRQMAIVKEVFVQQASLSQFPCVDLKQIQKFMQACKIDHLLQPNEVKKLFKESDQGNAQVNNPADALQRFEFIEFLLRVAKIVFVDTNKINSVAYAYSMLISDYIQPQMAQMALNNFRTRYLWTYEANRILNHHRDHLEKIYEVIKAKVPRFRNLTVNSSTLHGRSGRNSQMSQNSVSSSQGPEGRSSKMSVAGSRPDPVALHNARMANLMSLNEALNLLCDPMGLGLTIQQAKVCYSSSKMTVINENPTEDQMMYHSWGQGTIQSSHEYHHLRFCEFIELVSRVAQIKYEQFYQMKAPICQLSDDDFTFSNFLEFTVIKLIGNVLKVRAFPLRDLEEDMPSCSDDSD